jgi:hypothetical protein
MLEQQRPGDIMSKVNLQKKQREFHEVLKQGFTKEEWEEIWQACYSKRAQQGRGGETGKAIQLTEIMSKMKKLGLVE